MLERRSFRWAFVVAAACLAAAPPTQGQVDDASNRNVRVHIGERLTRDDNLYRLPEGIDPAILLGPSARRDDRIASTFVDMDGRWRRGEQELVLDTLVTAHRFNDNADLDNTSGEADLTWNWRVGSRWSGQAGGRRKRTLASFANTTSLDKDLVDTTTYHGRARFDVGPRWRATLNARQAATAHSNSARRNNDGEIRAGAVGLEYHTPSANSIGWEYSYARAAFMTPVGSNGAGSVSDYEERAASVNLRYVLSSRLVFDGSVGHTDRSYPRAADDFSGGVWRAALQWSPTGKTRVTLQRWRELKAHVDAESDAFVSTGTGLAAAWSPLDTIDIVLQLSREEQRYIGAADTLVEAARFDTPRTRSLSFSYEPTERVSFDLAYRRETRESNRFRFDYDAESLSIGGEIRF